jgi:hypothetical protein
VDLFEEFSALGGSKAKKAGKKQKVELPEVNL